MLLKGKFFLNRSTVFFLLFTILPLFGGAVMSYLGLAESERIAETGIFFQLTFFLLISLFTGLGFFPASAGAIVFFGVLGIAGFPAAAVSYFLSLCVSVYVKKFLSERMSAQLFPENEKFTAAVQKRGFKLVFFCRLSPILPFPAMNFALLSAGIPRRTYLFGSMLGMLPRLFFTGMMTVSLNQALNNQFSTENLLILTIGLTGIAGMMFEGKRIMREAGMLKAKSSEKNV